MPEQYLTPPPHELLADKSSFYARSGLFFLFIFSLIFALTACNGGSGGSSSNKMQDPSSDGGDSSSDDLSIVFSSVDNTADTVIGMREFLLTVTYKDLADGVEESLVFIVGESSKPPAWSAVENHPAKITRSFDNVEKQTREIYFSATEKLPTNSPLLVGDTAVRVDLSQASGEENTYSRANIPGVMTPATPYYVHVYADGDYVKISPSITTAAYPSTFPAQYDSETPKSTDDFYSVGQFHWGMQMWKSDGAVDGDNYRLRTVEVRRGELSLWPTRYMSPLDLDDPKQGVVCINSGFPLNSFPFQTARGTSFTSKIIDILRIVLPVTETGQISINNFGIIPLVSFGNSAQVPSQKHNEVFDFMSNGEVLLQNYYFDSEAKVEDYLENGLTLAIEIRPPCIDENFVYGLKGNLLSSYKVVEE